MKHLYLDVPTTILLLVFGNLAAMAALLAYQSRSSSRTPARFYIAGKLVQALAWALLWLRGQIPDLLSIYVGNPILFAGFGLEALALCEADGRIGRWKQVVGLATGLGIVVFSCFARSPDSRIAVASLSTAAIYACLSLAMFKTADRSSLHTFIAWASLAYCAILGFRTAWAMEGGASLGLMTPSLSQSLAFIPLHIALLIGGMGFMLLTKERSDSVLRESEDKYRTLVEKASEAIVIAQDERFAFVNRRMAELLGSSVETLTGGPFLSCIWPEDRDMVGLRHRKRIQGQAIPETYDFRVIGADASPRWVSMTATLVQWKGRPASLCLLTDIDARKRQEERIEGLLKDKELLLREVHHRMKNNLNVAMSLLSLQSGGKGACDPDEVLLDARNRLRSMVELYDRLYQVGDFEAISVRDYLPSLVGSIMAVFPLGAGVALDLELEDIRIDPQRLSSLGIIINEIVTNSMKYAFDFVAQPRISISMKSSMGRVILVCADNGVGFPGGIGVAAPLGFGTQLITMLAEQLDAEARVDGRGGTSWRIDFPEAKGR